MLGLFVVGMGLALLVPGAEGQDKKTDNKAKDKVAKEDATPADYAGLAQIKEIVGKIAAVDTTSGTMTFTFEWSHWEPNANAAKGGANPNQKALQEQQQLMREYEQIMRAKNPVQKQQALMKLQQHMARLQAGGGAGQNMFKVVKSSKDFELELTSDLKVARLNVERKFDDEGELVKLTDEQLKKLKSADVPGGYTAAGSDLKVGQTVKLWLSPPSKDKKKTPATGDTKSDKTETAKGEGKDKLTGGTTDIARPIVRMVLITEESTLPEPKETPKKKKK